MKLWLLARVEMHGYDEICALVIRAEDEINARRMAAERSSDEGPLAWLDEKRSTCQELLASGEPEIVMVDFNAG